MTSKCRVPRTPGQQRRLRYLALYTVAGWSPSYPTVRSRLAYAWRNGRRLNRVLQ